MPPQEHEDLLRTMNSHIIEIRTVLIGDEHGRGGVMERLATHETDFKAVKTDVSKIKQWQDRASGAMKIVGYICGGGTLLGGILMLVKSFFQSITQ